MKYMGMPMGMWALFGGSFQKKLETVLGYDRKEAKAIAKAAKPKYKKIIRGLPPFEKEDRFQMNAVNCAMLGAFVLSMPRRPDVKALTEYYAKAMMTGPMKWFCRKSENGNSRRRTLPGWRPLPGSGRGIGIPIPGIWSSIPTRTTAAMSAGSPPAASVL